MRIPGGTTLYIGPPAKPIPKHVSDAVGTALANVSEIVGKSGDETGRFFGLAASPQK